MHEGEVDESLQGAPAAAGGALLHLDWSDCPLRTVVGERHREVDREAQDHVFVAGESSDQSAGLGCGAARVLRWPWLSVMPLASAPR